VIEQRFGESEPFSLGVEEELMILDGESLQQKPAVAELLRELDGETADGRFKTELFASVVELNTPVCGTATEARERILELRRAVVAAAERLGLAIAAAGTHPRSRPEEQEIVPERRYQEMLAYAGPSARRQGVNGLHVHVGMPSGDGCLHALEAILPWLPVILALSSNSPYFAGRDSEFASSRAPVLAELPRSGAPPMFRTFAEWERYVERVTALKLPADYTALWWDVRPHPRFGTLEVRIPDQPTDVERTAALVALVQALCAAALDGSSPECDAGSRAIYQQNRWAAARFGLAADLIDATARRKLRASELVRELLELVEPAAQALGSAELLAVLDPERSEADRQLERGREHGLEAVCRDLVERSVPSP
jgi:carboxylate-amine ligase